MQVRLRTRETIVKQIGWVWVIGKGNEVSLGKIEKKEKDYTDLRRWNGDKVSSCRTFLRLSESSKFPIRWE